MGQDGYIELWMRRAGWRALEDRCHAERKKKRAFLPGFARSVARWDVAPLLCVVPVSGWEGSSARVRVVRGRLWAARSTRDRGRPRGGGVGGLTAWPHTNSHTALELFYAAEK